MIAYKMQSNIVIIKYSKAALEGIFYIYSDSQEVSLGICIFDKLNRNGTDETKSTPHV